MGNLITIEKKHIKLVCSKCNKKVYIDYKKEILCNLYCENCIMNNGYEYLGEIRYVRIEYK